MSDSLVIIPTYNERENIERMIDTVFSLSYPFQLLIVDDGSPDGTGNLVRQAQQRYGERLHLLERSGKLGLGTAYITGFRWGLDQGYTYIFEMDADFSHPPQDLIRLRDACVAGADLAIGSRYVKDGGVKDWPADRVFLSKGASLYVRMVTWMPVMDPTAGFICYHEKVLRAIDLDKIQAKGYAFQIEMKYAAHLLNFKIAEVPIIFTDRQAGTSKMDSSIITEAVLSVLRIRYRSLIQSYRDRRV